MSPTIIAKYPPKFGTFQPVCNSVELGNCSQEELVNAYNNSIVYTDFLLHQIIEELKKLKDYKSTMIFVSDHGESLGENNPMYGLPISMAPKEQIWNSVYSMVFGNVERLKPKPDGSFEPSTMSFTAFYISLV